MPERSLREGRTGLSLERLQAAEHALPNLPIDDLIAVSETLDQLLTATEPTPGEVEALLATIETAPVQSADSTIQ